MELKDDWMHKKNKSVLKHLKEDSKTWKKIRDIADKEYKSDLKLINKLKWISMHKLKRRNKLTNSVDRMMRDYEREHDIKRKKMR